MAAWEIQGPPSSLEIPDNVSVSRFVLEKAAKYGTAVALVEDATGRYMTYSNLVSAVCRLANGLISKGLKKGDAVCVHAPNVLEYFVIVHGVLTAGGVAVTSNPLSPPAELSRELDLVQSVFIFTMPDLLPNVRAALTLRQSNTPLKAVFTVGECAGCQSVTSLMTNQSDAWPDVTINGRTDVALVTFSSGTTGLPKAVAQTHLSYVTSMCQLMHKDVAYLGPNEVVTAQLPLYHGFAIICILNAALMFGAKIIVLGKFNLDQYLDALDKHKVTTMVIVPPIAVLLTINPAASRKPMSSVRTSVIGGAPLGVEPTFRKCFPHVCVRNLFGMSEAGIVMVRGPSGLPEGSVGSLMPGTTAKVVKEDGSLCGVGEVGELWVKSGQIMIGYLNNSKATAASFDSGWFKTGDLVYYDKGYNFYIIDRLKELIKYKGNQVPPAELEEVLLMHPGIDDAAVVGVPDDLSGQIPKAFVVMKRGQDLTERQVIDFVASHVAPQKKIRLVEFISSVPKSPSGKILRRLLVKRHVKGCAKL